MKKTVTYNKKTKLFTIPEAGGWSCLGLEVCWRRASRLAAELGECLPEDYRQKRFDSPLALYADYCRLLELGAARNTATGWRSESELTRELIGLEGKRVEIRHRWDSGREETSRFIVGKSTGWLPCHLEIKRRGSSGGGAVCLGRIKSVQVVG